MGGIFRVRNIVTCRSYLSSAGPVYKRDPYLVITVHADVLAPNGARPSAGTVMTTKSDMFSSKFLWQSWFPIIYILMTSYKIDDEIPRNLARLGVLSHLA